MNRILHPCVLGVLICGTLAASHRAAAAADEPLDMNKARQLYQRQQRGEQLTDDEQAYLDRAKAERARQQAANNGAAGNAMAPAESTGLVPLTELTAKYKGVGGGLYGNGKNDPPAEQMKRALAAAQEIRPLDADGKPAQDGKIVLLSIGMSNTTQEYSRFKALADKDPRKSPNVVVVDAAQGGMDAAAWLGGEDPKSAKVWPTADARLKEAGCSLQQVQAVWLKQALIQPAKLGEFPRHADALQQDIVKILNLAKTRYPNLRLAFLSSRIYAGYATTQLNPEPYAYESAFAVRGVIEQQMKGDPAMNSDPAKGDVKAPVVLWGPYMWADGVKGRKLDALVWNRADLGGDGTHPSETGREKVAQMLLTFFKTDAAARGWFLAPAK